MAEIREPKTLIDVRFDYDDFMYAGRTIMLRIPRQPELDDCIGAVRELEQSIRGDISKLPDTSREGLTDRSLDLRGVQVEIGPHVSAELASLGLSFAAHYLMSHPIQDEREISIVLADPYEAGLLEPDTWIECRNLDPADASDH